MIQTASKRMPIYIYIDTAIATLQCYISAGKEDANCCANSYSSLVSFIGEQLHLIKQEKLGKR